MQSKIPSLYCHKVTFCFHRLFGKKAKIEREAGKKNLTLTIRIQSNSTVHLCRFRLERFWGKNINVAGKQKQINQKSRKQMYIKVSEWLDDQNKPRVTIGKKGSWANRKAMDTTTISSRQQLRNRLSTVKSGKITHGIWNLLGRLGSVFKS